MKINKHEWLSLVEVEGNVLSLATLNDRFPAGFPRMGIDARHSFERTERNERYEAFQSAYDEFVAASTNRDAKTRDDVARRSQTVRNPKGEPVYSFEELCAGWVKFVLDRALAYYEDARVTLLEERDLDDARRARYSVEGPSGERYAPDYVLEDDLGKALLFVKAHPYGTSLTRSDDATPAWDASPVEKASRLCHAQNRTNDANANDSVLALVTNGRKWTLVVPHVDRPSGYLAWDAQYWFVYRETLDAFCGLLRAENLIPTRRGKGRLQEMLAESAENQEEVTTTLARQVETAIETLLTSLTRAEESRETKLLADVDAKTLYDAALTVMLRLVFILCAEERGMLLLGKSDLYDESYALSTLRAQLEEADDALGGDILERRCDAWARLLALFRMIHGGCAFDAREKNDFASDVSLDVQEKREIKNRTVRLVAHGGSLFDPDAYPFLEGRAAGTKWRETPADPLPVDNKSVLLLLRALQVLEAPTGAIPLSYRGLDVERIGNVYEGLLEYTARRADRLLLGLSVASGKETTGIVAFDELEKLREESDAALLAYVQKETGRTLATLRKEYAEALKGNFKIPKEIFDKVCDVDAQRKIAPYANWLRLDVWGRPVVYFKDAYYLANSSSRRDTGTHYTPRAAAAAATRKTLEPVVYRGPEDASIPREKWVLKSAREILDLKVCDPAMGSGAFLAQVARYLGDRLCEAWEIAEKKGLYIDATGEPMRDEPRNPMPKEETERRVKARFLVAQNCLYGVDINPMAVELAKLSIWLETLSPDLPFVFLDHALRCGDSLLGVTDAAQLQELRLKPNWSTSGKGTPLTRNLFVGMDESGYMEAVASALEERQKLRKTDVLGIDQIRSQEDSNKKIQERTRPIRLLADAFVGALMTDPKSGTKWTEKREERLNAILGEYAEFVRSATREPESVDPAELDKIQRDVQRDLNVDLPATLPDRRPFHWALEFPEVFQQGGFDAICGNPPFIGGSKITGSFGTAYRNYIISVIADGTKGSADLVAYFHLRTFQLLRAGGVYGLFACNTIAEGDTRQVGLERLSSPELGGVIISAQPNLRWSGTAAVCVSPVWVYKPRKVRVNGKEETEGWQGLRRIFDGEENGKVVDYISPYLTSQEEWSPHVLKENDNQSFIGSYIHGLGFTLSEEEALALIDKNAINKEALFPYLNGEDLNSSHAQAPSRWVINFWDWPLSRKGEGSWNKMTANEREVALSFLDLPIDYPGRVAADFPELLQIVAEKVKPIRLKMSVKQLRTYWWHYKRQTSALYHAIGRGSSFAKHPKEYNEKETVLPHKVLVATRVTKYFTPFETSLDYVFSDSLTILLPHVPGAFLSSSLFQDWVWKQGSRLATTLRFTPSDCYETFPFPRGETPGLEELGERFDALRREIMTSEKIGLTALYNRFHDERETDERILAMRDMQREIDAIAVKAYGWDDVPLEHGFHHVSYQPEGQNLRYTVSEKARVEFWSRLSKLNRERYAQEQEQEKEQKRLRGKKPTSKRGKRQ